MFHIFDVHVHNWNQTSYAHLSPQFPYPKSIATVKFTRNCERSFALQDPWVALTETIEASGEKNTIRQALLTLNPINIEKATLSFLGMGRVNLLAFCTIIMRSVGDTSLKS